MGTSCMFSVRRCAVTVISAMPSVSFVSAAGAACAAPMADPLKIAAIAYDNFWLEFMRPSLLFCCCQTIIDHSQLLFRHNRELSYANVTMAELSLSFNRRYAIKRCPYVNLRHT